MWEYKILEGTKQSVQTTLNQWRHEFEIQVTAFGYRVQSDEYYALIMRKKKNESTS